MSVNNHLVGGRARALPVVKLLCRQMCTVSFCGVLLAGCVIDNDVGLPVNYIVDRHPLARDEASSAPGQSRESSVTGAGGLVVSPRAQSLTAASTRPVVTDRGSALSPPVVNRSTAKPRTTGQLQEFAVIAYHRIGHDSSPYTIDPETFVGQMLYLQNSGFHVITLQQVLDHFEYGAVLPPDAVLITVDDGHKSSYTQIFPVLKRYGYSAVFFPYSEYINNGGLTRAMVREMVRSGHAEFQLHSETHAALTLKHDFETREQYEQRIFGVLVRPIDYLESLSGTRPVALAYPYGKVDRVVERLVRKAGITIGFTVNCAKNTRETRRTKLNRCTVAAADSMEEFAAKLNKPAYVHTVAGGENQFTAGSLDTNAHQQNSSPSDFIKPQFLGNIAHREVFRNVPIEPFSGYFLDSAGDGLHYRASKLPTGLLIDQNSGIISGVPAADASHSLVTVIATDKRGRKTVSNTFRINVY